MTTSSTTCPFLYGSFPVDSVFSDHYQDTYSRASSYPLPEMLPYHHPLLSSLEGVYPFQNTLPPWWQECVAQVKLERLKPLLATLSAREFREGCIDPPRWKALREALPEEERRQLPSSPKLAFLLAGTDWSGRFGTRGSTVTPDQLNVVVSTKPLDFLYMSNGRDWRSCQHFSDGCENYKLPGNFYDTNVAVAMVLAPNTCVGEDTSVLARTTLRVFRSQGQLVLTIGRTYHNNETLAFLLLRHLAGLFDARHLCWGFITEVNTLTYCEEGYLGADLCQRLEQEVCVESESCPFPLDWYVPYVDGGDSDWSHDWDHEEQEEHYSWKKLSATVNLMGPQALPHCPTLPLSLLTRPVAVGLLPRFL